MVGTSNQRVSFVGRSFRNLPSHFPNAYRSLWPNNSSSEVTRYHSADLLEFDRSQNYHAK